MHVPLFHIHLQALSGVESLLCVPCSLGTLMITSVRSIVLATVCEGATYHHAHSGGQVEKAQRLDLKETAYLLSSGDRAAGSDTEKLLHHSSAIVDMAAEVHLTRMSVPTDHVPLF